MRWNSSSAAAPVRVDGMRGMQKQSTRAAWGRCFGGANQYSARSRPKSSTVVRAIAACVNACS